MKADEQRKNLISAVEALGRRYGKREVWNDLVTMYSCSLSNLFDKRFYYQREKMYMDIVGKYSKKELIQFADMITCIIIALEAKPEQDFLGSVYNDLNLCNKHLGQVLTPYSVGCSICNTVCKNLTGLIKEKHVISVYDPCCGPGCLLIAYANEARRQGVDFQNRILYVGQDIDRTVALMCYIQLSLLGCAAFIKIGNSLDDPLVHGDLKSSKVWFTPYYFSDLWELNRRFKLMHDVVFRIGRD